MHDFGYVSLDILYAYPEDTGEYMCKAKNAKGEATTQCKISVEGRPGLVFQRQAPRQSDADLARHLSQYTNASAALREDDVYLDGKAQPPAFKTDMQNVIIEEGEFARFECQLAPVNDPTMKVEWYRNGKPLMMGKNQLWIWGRGQGRKREKMVGDERRRIHGNDSKMKKFLQQRKILQSAKESNRIFEKN